MILGLRKCVSVFFLVFCGLLFVHNNPVYAVNTHCPNDAATADIVCANSEDSVHTIGYDETLTVSFSYKMKDETLTEENLTVVGTNGCDENATGYRAEAFQGHPINGPSFTCAEAGTLYTLSSTNEQLSFNFNFNPRRRSLPLKRDTGVNDRPFIPTRFIVNVDIFFDADNSGTQNGSEPTWSPTFIFVVNPPPPDCASITNEVQCNTSSRCEWTAESTCIVKPEEVPVTTPSEPEPPPRLTPAQLEALLVGDRRTPPSGLLAGSNCAVQGTCSSVDDLVRVVISIGEFLFSILGAVAFAMFVFGGFMMILSFGNAERFKQGQKILVAAVVGMLIAFGAYVLVDFILDAVEFDRSTFGG